jgi:hypothetical protein
LVARGDSEPGTETLPVAPAPCGSVGRVAFLEGE